MYEFIAVAMRVLSLCRLIHYVHSRTSANGGLLGNAKTPCRQPKGRLWKEGPDAKTHMQKPNFQLFLLFSASHFGSRAAFAGFTQNGAPKRKRITSLQIVCIVGIAARAGDGSSA
jgi:hypothetical protein